MKHNSKEKYQSNSRFSPVHKKLQFKCRVKIEEGHKLVKKRNFNEIIKE